MMILSNMQKTIIKYVAVIIILIYSIYEIAYYSIKLYKNYEIAYVVGVGVYSLTLIASIICLIILIKKTIYRSKFTHNDFE